MPYIDRDIALKLLERNSITKHITFSDGVSIYDTIANIPAADVVPKSEYDNLKSQFEDLDHECERLERAESNRHDAIQQAKSDLAREIFAEIDGFIENNIKEITKAYEGGRANGKFLCDKFSAFIDMKKYFAVLKNKYTNN